MASYTVIISEEQRAALLEVLTGADPDEFLAEDGALEYWVSMLQGLPKEEAETPGVLHGFCL